jgi:hypothetical protein
VRSQGTGGRQTPGCVHELHDFVHGEQLLNVLPRNRLGETVEFSREDDWYRINQRALDQTVRVGESEKAAQT